MKSKILISTFFLISSNIALAAEVITVSGEQRYMQVFSPKAVNLASHRLAQAESYGEAVGKIALSCQGDNYQITNETVSESNGGGVATVTTTLEILCNNPVPIL